ncbi:MAG: DUF2147 domain-containing protein [Pseudomonadales bacterium]
MKTLILSFTLLLTSTMVLASAAPDNIIGRWQSEDKEAIFEFYKHGEHYASKLVYGKQVVEADGKTSKKDIHNPDPSLRDRDILGIVNIQGLTYKNARYSAGKIYDARTGKLYDCKVEIKEGALYLRGYLGVSWLGQTSVWHRLETDNTTAVEE